MKASNLTPWPLAMSRVSLLVGAIALLLLTACTQVVPTSAPGATPSAPLLAQEQAVNIALSWVIRPMPGVTPVENPRNPVARLMTLLEYGERVGEGGQFTEPDPLVWVVQVEGESYSAGIAAAPRTKYGYATVVIDARSGTVIRMSRTFAPLF